MSINADALKALSKDDLIALLTQVVTEDVAQEPKGDVTLATCGSTLTLSGKPCGTKTQGGRDCGRHGTKAEVERKRKEQQEFLAKRREYAANAKARESSKEDNRALAVALRAVGVTPNGEAWGIAKGHVAEDGMTFEQAAAKVAPDYA